MQQAFPHPQPKSHCWDTEIVSFHYLKSHRPPSTVSCSLMHKGQKVLSERMTLHHFLSSFFFYTLVCLFLCYVSHCKSLIHFCLVLNLAYYGCNGLVRTSISTTRFSKFLVLKKCGEWQKTMVSVWMRNRRLMITAYSITSVQTCYCEHRHQT